MCRDHQIMGFPSIRVYRRGTDDIVVHGHHEHESYRGDRTLEALTKFADSLIPSAGLPHYYIPGLAKVAKSDGCNLSGACRRMRGCWRLSRRSPPLSCTHPTPSSPSLTFVPLLD